MNERLIQALLLVSLIVSVTFVAIMVGYIREGDPGPAEPSAKVAESASPAEQKAIQPETVASPGVVDPLVGTPTDSEPAPRAETKPPVLELPKSPQHPVGPPAPTFDMSLFEQALAALDAADADADPTKLIRRISKHKGFLNQLQSARVWRRYEQNEQAWLGSAPGPGKPATMRIGKDTAPAKQILIFDRLLHRMPAQYMKAMRHAEVFPGNVPADAERIDRTVSIDMAQTRWRCTGLYAPPGESVEVLLSANAVPLGLTIRVGAHRDPIARRDTWHRWPDTVWTFTVDRAAMLVANPLGGLIYVQVPDKAPSDTRVLLKFTGAVEAPRYVLGQTSTQKWAESIRHAPAPWGEVECGEIIATVPARLLRTLDDPVPVLAFWDRVADAQDDLSCRDVRRYKERFVFDLQVAYGYMHAGYPIAGPIREGQRFLDLARLQREGNWGLFHELGHNHQSRAWTPSELGEVTVNIFSMYTMETVVGLETEKVGWFRGALPKVRSYYERLPTKGETSSTRDFGTLLGQFMHLRREFGWDFFKRAFQAYKDMEPSKHPRSDPERRAMWVLVASHTAERDLTPFFERWGYDVTEDMKRELAKYPTWNPKQW
jgi:hypothetical protein